MRPWFAVIATLVLGACSSDAPPDYIANGGGAAPSPAASSAPPAGTAAEQRDVLRAER